MKQQKRHEAQALTQDNVIEHLDQIRAVIDQLSQGQKGASKDKQSSHKRIDELLKTYQEIDGKLTKALSEQRHTLSLYEAVLDNAVDGILIIDQKGIVQQFNKASETIFGYKASEVLGKNIKMLMPEPYQSEHDGYIRHYRETGEKKIIGIGREVKGRKKDGTIFPIDLSVSEVKGEQRTLFSGIIRDISERKAAEEEILRSNEELERFAYSASHDLQEPLRIIKNFSSMLKEDYAEELDDRAKSYIDYTVQSSLRMQELVNDLLEYSRLDSKTVDVEEIDGNKHLGFVLENLAQAIDESKAIITKDDLPKIFAKPPHFRSLMQNLIGNAIKYMEKDKVPKIHIGVNEKEADWVFYVRDNGIGIKKENLDDIFTVFQRLHTKQQYEGTGVGLAICKKIATAMGGTIFVESQYGKGSTFYITIPKELKR